MSPKRTRAAARRRSQEPRAVGAPLPPPEVSVTVEPNVPDEARAQREAETDAARGVVIPTTHEGRSDG